MIDDAKLAVLTDEELARQPFDELVAALQRTVQQLEAGTVGLEESIELYRTGSGSTPRARRGCARPS